MKFEDFYHLVSGRADGPWVIFLHGLLGSSRNWVRIVTEFQPDFAVLNLDQRGHGKTHRPPSGYAPEDFARDLKIVMDGLGIKKASLVGHSMGGRNALVFSHLYPERVSRLVLEDIGPQSTYENGQKFVDLLKGIPVPFSDKRRAKEFLLNKLSDPQLGNFLYTRMIETANGVDWDFPVSMVEEIITKGRGEDQWEELKKLKCPTLVIRGELSAELTRDEFDKMLKINPLVSGVEIKDAGHWIHFEKPKEFVMQVLHFLKNR